jgi:hypothetical protein
MVKMPLQLRALILCVALTAWTCDVTTHLHAQQSDSSPAHTGNIPDARFYSLVFRHILRLQSVGEAPLTAGAPTTAMARFYQDKVGANSQENAILIAEATKWKAEVDPVDSQAHNLIETIHARTPNGQLKSGEDPPSVPQELIDLQQERDAITLKHVNNLRTSFGNARFAYLDGTIRKSAHVTFKSSAPVQVHN